MGCYQMCAANLNYNIPKHRRLKKTCYHPLQILHTHLDTVTNKLLATPKWNLVGAHLIRVSELHFVIN